MKVYTNLKAALKSTEKEIKAKVNIVRSKKLMEALFSLPNLIELELTDANKVGLIPSSIAKATKLKGLTIRQFKGKLFPKELFQLPNLERMYLVHCHNVLVKKEYWGMLERLKSFSIYRSLGGSFPKGILDISTLEYLSISNTDWKILPKEMNQLTKLQELSIWGTKMTKLPETLADLSELKRLSIYYASTTVPSWMDKMQQLEHLSFEPQDKTGDFPSSILKLKNLKQLYFRNSLTEVPKEIVALENLESLRLSYNQITTLPNNFYKLKNLKDLNLDKNRFKKIPAIIAALPQLETIKMDYQDFHKSELNRFNNLLKWLKQEKIIGEERHFYAVVWDKVSLNEEALNYKWLHKALASKVEPLNTYALDYMINSDKRGYRPFKTGDELLLVGKTTMSKTDIKAKLKEQGIKTTTKRTATTTHIFIQERTKLKVEDVLEGTHCFLTERQLTDYLNKVAPDYIVEDAQTNEGGGGMDEQIISLLTSFDSANIQLALEMLKSGGVPHTVADALFAVYKLADDSKHRSKAGQYLKQIASDKLKTALKRRIDFRKEVYHYSFGRNVAAFEETELDMVRFAINYYKKIRYYGCAAYIVKSNREDEILEFLRLFSNDGILRMSSYSHGLDTFIAPIFELTHLRELHISLKSVSDLSDFFPDALSKLQNLEILNYYCSYPKGQLDVEGVAKQVKKLPNLKVLKLSFMDNKTRPKLRALLPEIKVEEH